MVDWWSWLIDYHDWRDMIDGHGWLWSWLMIIKVGVLMVADRATKIVQHLFISFAAVRRQEWTIRQSRQMRQAKQTRRMYKSAAVGVAGVCILVLLVLFYVWRAKTDLSFSLLLALWMFDGSLLRLRFVCACACTFIFPTSFRLSLLPCSWFCRVLVFGRLVWFSLVC